MDLAQPVEGWLDYNMPGAKLGLTHRIQSKSMLFLYKDIHLPKREYRRWLTNDVIKKVFDGQIEGMRISHKTGKEEGEPDFKCSYVILCLKEAIATRNIRLFRWEGIQPAIRTLKTGLYVDAAMTYLDNWKYVSDFIPRKIIREPKIVYDDVVKERVTHIKYPATVLLSASDEPPQYYVRDLLGWQLEAYNTIVEHCRPGHDFSDRTPLPPTTQAFYKGIAEREQQKATEQKRSELASQGLEQKEIERQVQEVLFETLQKQREAACLKESEGKTNREVQYVNCGKRSGLTSFLQAIKYPKLMPDEAKARIDAIRARNTSGDDDPRYFTQMGIFLRFLERGRKSNEEDEQLKRDIGNGIEEHNSNRFMVVVGMPHNSSFARTVEQKKADGSWTGECVIFDLSNLASIPDKMYETLQVVFDKHYCRSIWVFTRHLPQLGRLTYDRWNFSKISADPSAGKMSNLTKLEYCLIAQQLNGTAPYGRIAW